MRRRRDDATDEDSRVSGNAYVVSFSDTGALLDGMHMKSETLSLRPFMVILLYMACLTRKGKFQ